MGRPLLLVGTLAMALVASVLLALPSAVRGTPIVESAYSRVSHSGPARLLAAREGGRLWSAGLAELQPPPQQPEQVVSSYSPQRSPYYVHAQSRYYPDRAAKLTGSEVASSENWASDPNSGTEGQDEGVGGARAYDNAASRHSPPDSNVASHLGQQVSHISESAEYSGFGAHKQLASSNLADVAGDGTQDDASQVSGSYRYSPSRHQLGIQEQNSASGDGGQGIDGLTAPSESYPPTYWEGESYREDSEQASETEANGDSTEDPESDNPPSPPAQSTARPTPLEHSRLKVENDEVDNNSNKINDRSHSVDVDDDSYDESDNDEDGADDNGSDDDSDGASEADDDSGVAHGRVTTPPVPSSDVSSSTARQEADQRPASDRRGNDGERKEEPEHQKDHSTKDQEGSRLNRPSYVPYYGLGRKLWYVPLWFSVYYIIYLTSLVIKSISRHKIEYPEAEKHHGWDKRSLADTVGTALARTVHRALRAAASKYD
ncbi:clumping factor A-like [Schistocerca gregaria]|uniref:clumping factor A-like n=1 Tax=Schistocerca gregaria TaxID=7010 RepID=UPI00211DD15B|nr:clumping factor A-like [Schistocerca gregaria]